MFVVEQYRIFNVKVVVILITQPGSGMSDINSTQRACTDAGVSMSASV